MTEPQYRVIADKDSTPDLASAHVAAGDRLVYDVIDADRWSLVRIERPVEGVGSSVQPPMREQIDSALGAVLCDPKAAAELGKQLIEQVQNAIQTGRLARRR